MSKTHEDYVVDTNVWVMVDTFIADATAAELDCIQACREWLESFRAGDARLVIDDHYMILGEYRRNVRRPDGRAYQILAQLETQPRARLIEVHIELDANGYAVVPPELEIHDGKDRKWIAVALAHTPTPPIVNATDSD